MGFLDEDPRWLRLQNKSWPCACCGGEHQGLPDLGQDRPAYWSGKDVPLPNSAIGSDSRNILTQDFCILDGEHYFVRGVVNLPIIGSDEQEFGLGVWTTLSKANFDTYVELFDDPSQSDLGPWFGWFANSLKGYPETTSLQCQVQPRDGRDRPLIRFGSASADHPLAVEQRAGITFDRILDLHALNGHDIRSALLQA